MKLHTVISATLTLLSVADASKKQCSTAKNNLMRCFTASTDLASSFCSGYLSTGFGVPMVTVTATVTATESQGAVATEVDVVTQTSLVPSFVTTTVTSVQTTFTTTTITAVAVEGANGQRKRHDVDDPIFHCVVKNTRKTELYAASSISSACSCLAPQTGTTTVTATSTLTDNVVETTTTSTTTVVQVVTVLPTTVVETAVETDVVTSIIFPSNPPPSSSPIIVSPSTTSPAPAASSSVVASLPPSCNGPNTFTSTHGNVWVIIFAGTGVSENPNNPSNQATPDVTTFPGTLSACEAADACANYVFALPNNDYNFDLHFLIAEQMWSCTGYFNALSSSSDWNVVDSNIGASYGFEY